MKTYLQVLAVLNLLGGAVLAALSMSDRGGMGVTAIAIGISGFTVCMFMAKVIGLLESIESKLNRVDSTPEPSSSDSPRDQADSNIGEMAANLIGSGLKR